VRLEGSGQLNNPFKNYLTIFFNYFTHTYECTLILGSIWNLHMLIVRILIEYALCVVACCDLCGVLCWTVIVNVIN
jgi:hypothetical protein